MSFASYYFGHLFECSVQRPPTVGVSFCVSFASYYFGHLFECHSASTKGGFECFYIVDFFFVCSFARLRLFSDELCAIFKQFSMRRLEMQKQQYGNV